MSATTYNIRHFTCAECGKHAVGLVEVDPETGEVPATLCRSCRDRNEPIEVDGFPAVYSFSAGYNDRLGRYFSSRREYNRYLAENHIEEVSTEEARRRFEEVASREPDSDDGLPMSREMEEKVNKRLYDLFTEKARKEAEDGDS